MIICIIIAYKMQNCHLVSFTVPQDSRVSYIIFTGIASFDMPVHFYRSENPKCRIFFPAPGARWPEIPYAVVSHPPIYRMLWFCILLPAGAQRQKRALRLFPDRGTLPESREYTENRITQKRSPGNLTTFLYDCLLSCK